MKYIDAEKLIAEIKIIQQSLESRDVRLNQVKKIQTECSIEFCKCIIDVITSLQQEQPEVDLEKEIKSYFNGWEYDPYSYEITTVEGNAPTLATLRGIARHFFELGLNARKED